MVKAALLSIAFVILLMSLSPTIPIQNQPQPLPTLTPTPIETTWQTYRNEKYGFEFQYPTNVLINTDLSSDSRTKDFMASVKFNDGSYLLVVSSEPEWPCGNESSYSIKPTIIDINQNKFTYYSISAGVCAGLDTIIYKSETKKPIYFVTYGPSNEETKSTYESNIRKILSTFKFLPDTSTWKTYKNEKYGISFKHPSYYQIKEFGSNVDPSSYSNRIIVFDTKNKLPEMGGDKLVAPNVMAISEVNDISTICDEYCTKRGEIIMGDNKYFSYGEGMGGWHYYVKPIDIYTFLTDEKDFVTSEILSSFKFTK